MANNISPSSQKVDMDRIHKVLKSVTDDNLAEMYARYGNQLRVEADCGNDDEEYAFLIELTDFLRGCIVQKYMEQKGYFQSEHDQWNRWERIRE